jgi:hypothetical protein
MTKPSRPARSVRPVDPKQLVLVSGSDTLIIARNA